METIYLYIIKNAGLLMLFFVSYFLFLRKETFFTQNRWFLLIGLFTSALLPLIFINRTIWIEPLPTSDSVPLMLNNGISTEIDWFEVYLIPCLLALYSLITIILLIKFALDFYNLKKIFKGKTIQKQADFKLVDIDKNIAPFSFFNYIVYNSSLYNQSELTNIIEHEKVHSEQNHTVDVLISRTFCILFWFNPIVWLYKRAIIQNLEFIADNEATQKLIDKKAYQYTLLKITTHENCVAITNHFYQSLIKKRIVMLNKNQSKKQNYWKYSLVIPALIAFVLLFQINVIAKEKELQKNTEKSTTANLKEKTIFKIDKNTTEAELKETSLTLKETYNVITNFSNAKRNSNGELTAIKIDLRIGKEVSKVIQTKSSEPIKPIIISITRENDGAISIDLETQKRIEDKKQQIKIVTLDSEINTKTERDIYINGEKVSEEEMKELNPDEIASIEVIKNTETTPSIRIITKDKSNNRNENVIRISNTKNSHTNSINPPTPPTAPTLTVKPPKFPNAPNAPKGTPMDNKAEWDAFAKKMAQYESQIEKMSPEIENFEEKMKLYEEQMKAYEKQIEAYYSNIK